MKSATLLLTVEEVAEQLRLGRSSAFNLLRDGVIPSFKLGGSRRVRYTDLEKYVNGLAQEVLDTTEHIKVLRDPRRRVKISGVGRPRSVNSGYGRAA